MDVEHNLVLITQDENIAGLINPKLALLRSFDKIATCNYSDALQTLETTNPNTIIIHATEQKKTLNLIKKIKEIKAYIPLILLLEDYDRDFIINSFDEKIDDYMIINSDDTEFLMRVIWSMKKNSLEQKNKEYFEILKNLKIINSQTEIYSIKYSNEIFASEIKKIVDKKYNAVFMLITLDEEGKTKISIKNFVDILKNSIRKTDIIAHMNGNRFALLLKKTDISGADIVVEKISSQLDEGVKIHAGISEVIDDNFLKIKNQTQDALFKSINQGINVVVNTDIEEQNLMKNWLDDIDISNKNFKLFKIKFNKKMEKVVAPAFYKIQKAWEEKLFNTKIEQKISEDASIFLLETEKTTGFVKITYPGFAKVKIDIIFQGLDSPENKQLDFDLKTLSEEKLTSILEDFINQFKLIS